MCICVYHNGIEGVCAYGVYYVYICILKCYNGREGVRACDEWRETFLFLIICVYYFCALFVCILCIFYIVVERVCCACMC